MWRLSLPWHKVLNAVVAELSIHKLKDKRGRIDSLWLSFAPKGSSGQNFLSILTLFVSILIEYLYFVWLRFNYHLA